MYYTQRNYTPKNVLVRAIQDEKRFFDYYQNMASQCAAAPIEEMFRRLARDQAKHFGQPEELCEWMCIQGI